MLEQKEKRNIKGGISLTYIRLIVYVVLGIFYPPFLLSKVGSIDNGLYFFASSLVSLLLLLSFGMENSYIKFATKYEKEEGEEGLKKVNSFYQFTFAIIGTLVILVGICLGFLYKYGIFTYENATTANLETLFYLILVFSLSVGLDFALSLYTWFMYFRRKFILEELLYLLVHVISIGLSFIFLAIGANVIIVAIINGAVMIFFDLLSLVYAKSKLKMGLAPLFKEKGAYKKMLKEVAIFSIYIFLLVIVSMVINNLGKVTLGHMVGMAAVTIFSYGLQFYTYEAQISNAITSAFAPRVNSLAIEKQDEEINSLFLKVSRIQIIVLSIIAGGFAACGEHFIRVWLGKSDITADGLNKIYLLSAIFLTMWVIPLSQQLGIEIQRAKNQHKFMAVVLFALAVLSAGLTPLFIYLLPDGWKMMGPLISIGGLVLVGYIIISSIYYQKKIGLKIHLYYRNLLIFASMSLIAYLAVYFIYHHSVDISSLAEWLQMIITGGTFVFINALFLGAYFLGRGKQRKDPA
ncbi:MAG: hypothetical protein K5694_03480 [Bacilli bacterium]|nr:hypothetical protein [Bacilli bacterium]